MRRWHEDLVRMRSRQHERRAEIDEWAGRGVTVLQPTELGRLRKRHVHGCSRARCGVCHPSKRWHRQADRARDERAWQRDLELA